MNKFLIQGEIISQGELNEGPNTEYVRTIVRVEYQGSDQQDHISILPVIAFGTTAKELARFAKGDQVQIGGVLERSKRSDEDKYPPVSLVANRVDEASRRDGADQ